MNQEEPLYAGNLLFPPHGKIVLKKSWHTKYCLLFNASKLGIERLEVYDSAEDYPKQPPHKIYTLENCIKISQRDATTFCVITKNWTQNFGTLTEISNWISAFQTVAFKDDDTTNTIGVLEDNELYCWTGEGIFTVRLQLSEAAKRCGLDPKVYTLIISSTSTKLKDNDTSTTLFTWPHRYIRRYGYRDGRLTFEAGRKCDSGEGTFHFEYENKQIFWCLFAKMKSMRKLLDSETTTSALDCGDNQFHAALSMEARSRSPLPPSPTSCTKFHDTSSSDSSQVSFLKQMVQPKPVKPPRKHIPAVHSDYEPVCMFSTTSSLSDYDKVEIRSEAWRTLGIDDVKHSETVDSDDESDCKSETIEETLPPLPPAPKLISTSLDSYDTLQFFGSNSKEVLGYKQMIVTTPRPSISPDIDKTISNDYEEVGGGDGSGGLHVDMEAVRLADDSHLGYGMIRKQSNPGTPTTAGRLELVERVPHHVVNDTAYAIISKPKRV